MRRLMDVVVIPAGCAFYVAKEYGEPHSLIGSRVEKHPALPMDMPVTSRIDGIFYSRHEVRYPASWELSLNFLPLAEQNTVRVFKLPKNPVGLYLVVLTRPRSDEQPWPLPYEDTDVIEE